MKMHNLHKQNHTKHTTKAHKTYNFTLALPYLCELYPDICLTAEEKAGETSVRVVEKCPEVEKYTDVST
jgi:hypothetical protein